jgi:hypothetical protein
LIAAHDSFVIFRRFLHVRTRILLLKQDEIVSLEDKLRDIDNAEAAPFFLGRSRADANPERLKVLSDLDRYLTDYGKGNFYDHTILQPRALTLQILSILRLILGANVPRTQL